MVSLTDVGSVYRRKSPSRSEAAMYQNLAENFKSGQMTPVTAIAKGVLGGMADRKYREAAHEEDARLKRYEAMIEQQLQQQQYMDDVKSSMDRLRLSQMERVERQASIDEALTMAEQMGDTTGLNKVLDSMPATKELIQRDLPEGAVLTGATIVNGHLLPVGTLPDGKQVFGQEGLPIGQMYSPDRQAANLKLESDKRLTDARVSEMDAKTQKVQAGTGGAAPSNGMPPEPAAGSGAMLEPPPAVDGSMPEPLPGAGRPATTGAQVGKLTEGQGKNTNYAIRMSGSMSTLNDLEGTKGFEPASLAQNVASEVPLVGNYALSDDFQKYKQAQREFLAGILRGDTGAAITKEEFALYGPMYFPQPGDGDDVIAQKRDARNRAFEGTKVVAGPGAAAVPQPRDLTAIKSKYGLE